MKVLIFLSAVCFSQMVFADFKKEIGSIEKKESAFFKKTDKQAKSIKSIYSKNKLNNDTNKVLGVLEKLDFESFCNDEGYLSKFDLIVNECNIKNLSDFEKSIKKMSCKNYSTELNFFKDILQSAKGNAWPVENVQSIKSKLVQYGQVLANSNKHEIVSYLMTEMLIKDFISKFDESKLDQIKKIEESSTQVEKSLNESLKNSFTKNQANLKSREEMDCFFLKERSKLRVEALNKLKENMNQSLKLLQ